VLRTLQAPRLVLEPQVAAHADEMFVVLGDPAIYEFENAPPPSAASLRARFTVLEARRSPDGREGWFNWVIRLRSGEAIGYMQATLMPDGSAGIGYELASAYWGRGLAREAALAMIDELFVGHGVTLLTAVAKRANQRSTRLLTRLGFAPARPELLAAAKIEDDELMMSRSLLPP
jgi:RimJ/RimL family protein N-acetyltransferase